LILPRPPSKYSSYWMACVCWDGLFAKLEYCASKSWEVVGNGLAKSTIEFLITDLNQISTAHCIKAWTAFLWRSMRKPYIRLFQLLITIAYSISPTSCFAAVRGEASCVWLPSTKSPCEQSDIRCLYLTNIKRLNVLERAQGPECSGSWKMWGVWKLMGTRVPFNFLGFINILHLVYVVVLRPYGVVLLR